MKTASVLVVLCGALRVVASPDGHALPPAPDATNAPAVLRSIFVSIPPQFERLKRAPVLFAHDLHTKALEKEGCEVCHPKKGGTLSFSFPAGRDERSPKALMDSIHAACTSCHNKRSAERSKSGPVTCGECHSEDRAYHGKEYLPALPREYNALKDPYHKQCVACHQKSATPEKRAGDLDWKQFHVRAQKQIEINTPEVVFDYYVHDKHQKALEKRCDLCHYLPPDLKEKLAAEGRQPTGQDWLRQQEQGKSWDKKESAHERCINCHLQRKAEKKSVGPVACGECHVDRMRPIKDMADVPPPDYADKQRILIHFEKAVAPGVPFNHKAHIAASRSCGDCHHETLESCAKCHTPTGAKEGGFITLAEAYHDADSSWSCVGCHEKESRKPDCAGCHHLRSDGMNAGSCEKCHTGTLDTLDRTSKIPAAASILGDGVKAEMEISLLEKEYEKTKVQHAKIAQKLTDISNNSRLATAFHTDETTICAGCHHLGRVMAGKPVPSCATCHTVRSEPAGRTPTLLGAYHQACLGCHRMMGYPEKEMPQKCEGCHKAKAKK
jgi:hypothetical protein